MEKFFPTRVSSGQKALSLNPGNISINIYLPFTSQAESQIVCCFEVQHVNIFGLADISVWATCRENIYLCYVSVLQLRMCTKCVATNLETTTVHVSQGEGGVHPVHPHWKWLNACIILVCTLRKIIYVHYLSLQLHGTCNSLYSLTSMLSDESLSKVLTSNSSRSLPCAFSVWFNNCSCCSIVSYVQKQNQKTMCYG